MSAGRPLFDDVSLQANRGDRIGLVGKSILFSLLRDASPDSGTIATEENATIGVHTLFHLQLKRHATVPPKRTDA